MRLPRPLVMPVILLLASALPAGAQGVNPSCQDPAHVGASLQGGNACQQALDSYSYTSQQFATLLGAGNMELARADAIGKFPNFKVALRFTGMNFIVPAFRSGGIASGPAVQGTVETQGNDYAIITADGAIGLFKGFDLGFGRLGAVDAILNVNLVPGSTAAGYSMTPNQKVYIGWGGRVGLLQEQKVLPAVGFTYSVRNLPQSYIVASDVFQNTIYLSQLKVNTQAWSATVGKHFGVVSLLLGGGQVKYTSSTVISWAVNGSNGTLPPASVGSTQTQIYGDAGFDLGVIGLVLEIGEVSGSQLATYNAFDPAISASRSFAAFAVTFGR